MWGELAGGLIGGALGMVGANQQNIWNNRMQDKQNAFNERMANTAHQREVADLREAGLNPILSAGGQGAAGSATGMVGAPNPMDQMASNVSGMSRLREDVKAIQAGVDKTKAETDVARSAKKIADSNAISAEAAAFSAQNKVRFEKAHPDFFGGVDALGSRLGLLGSSASSLLGGGAALKYLLKGGAKRSASPGPVKMERAGTEFRGVHDSTYFPSGRE